MAKSAKNISALETMEHSDRNKPKLSNTNDKDRCASSSLRDADIRQHITQISKVKGPHRKTVFLPLNGPGREESERLQNQRRVRTPRNLKVYDYDSDEGGSSGNSSYAFEEFDENELRATVASALGRKSFSNSRIERRWANREPKAIVDAEPPTGRRLGGKSEFKTTENMFPRLVAMRSLVTNRAQEDNEEAINLAKRPNDVGENSSCFEFVPDAAEPEVFRREMRNERPDKDFTVEHIGRVAAVTAREFLIDLDPEDFAWKSTGAKRRNEAGTK